METKVIGSTDLEPFHHRSDTREILAHAKRQAEDRNYADYVIMDVDSHHSDNVSWKAVVRYIEDPVVRAAAEEYHAKVASPPYGVVNNIMYYQDVGGRIQHQAGWREPVDDTGHHADVTIIRRAIECMGLDYMVVFPTKLLDLGKHPVARTEALLAYAYNRWLVENILSVDPRVKSLLYLPISVPEESVRIVEEFSEHPGVIGFMVTSTRNKPVYDNVFMRLYATLEERGHAPGLPWRLFLGRGARHGPDEQVHGLPLGGLRALEPDSPDQLGDQRPPGAVFPTGRSSGLRAVWLGCRS